MGILWCFQLAPELALGCWMLKHFLFPSLYQEPDLAWASSQLTFPGHPRLSKMTTRGVECQWLIPTHEETKAHWHGSEDTPSGRTFPLWAPDAHLSREGFEKGDLRASFHFEPVFWWEGLEAWWHGGDNIFRLVFCVLLTLCHMARNLPSRDCHYYLG